MKKIKVNLKDRSYDILVGNKIIPGLPACIRRIIKQTDAIIITNSTIAKRYAGALKKALKGSGFSHILLTVPDSEKAKSIFYLNKLLNKIARYAKDKLPFIIALGGGVVGDVAGFLASIYKRGIPYIQIPTTLLAQIDSSIGGKTALDLTSGKNLVGSFYQPKLVLCDIGLLKSLPQREISSGLAELIKYALIKDVGLFNYLEKNYKNLLKLKPANLLPAVSCCVKIKAQVVSKDEREKRGLRTILNFGHTVGHAIESASNYRYNHGESVALGMLAEARIALSLKLINNDIYDRILKLIRNCRLPTKIRKIKCEKIMQVIYFDKKFVGKLSRFVLPTKIGKVIIKENIKQAVIREAIKDLS
ncbi:MAG: 3-dehydroquinate synthase [Candidatus Omnitrophica bacterium]|nr:3-dehydroquinate synthase [Candidatus Omnitrophota bacterium]